MGPDKTPRGSQASDMRSTMRSEMPSSRVGSDLKFGSEIRGSDQGESQEIIHSIINIYILLPVINK